MPISAFYKNKARPDGLGTACKTCHKGENLQYRHRHADRVYEKELSGKQTIKEHVFSHYCEGEILCKKCGFKDIRALSLDHIDGNGTKHRKELNITAGTQFYRWVRDNDFPEMFQVLCMNCQWIKRHENQEHNGKKR